ncbi:MAG: 8-oxo-dGTP diphosphatase MutT [Verrucomicrobiae bacterium]|nr:8-oxo-dGTP diphosphatase MutT [Verrucomicrobiae bacterium]
MKPQPHPQAVGGAEESSAGGDRKFIEVSAALIFRGGWLLITQRHAKSHLGGYWEFPGGKREAGETFEQCLVREIREELGVTIAVGELFAEVSHTYPEKAVHLKFFRCLLLAGEPQPLDCAAVKWVQKAGLAGYQFPAADAQLLAQLQSPACVWT